MIAPFRVIWNRCNSFPPDESDMTLIFCLCEERETSGQKAAIERRPAALTFLMAVKLAVSQSRDVRLLKPDFLAVFR